MENLITTAVWSGGATRWLLPPLFALICYEGFSWLESIISDESRDRCTKFLLKKNYNCQIKIIPYLAKQVIDSFFGDKHLTKKCIIRSILFSSSSLFVAFIVSFLYNPQKIFNFFDKILSLDAKGFLYLLLARVFFCLVPDYLMLGKTRGIIWALQRINLNSVNIIAIAIIDFLANNFIFMAIFTISQIISLEFYQWHIGKVPNLSGLLLNLSTSNVFIFPTFFIVESVVLIPSGLLYFLFPLANFFWAAMIPSVWLWLYVLFSIVSHFLLSLNPLFDVLNHILDIKNQPLRSIGAFVSIFVAIFTFFAVFCCLYSNNFVSKRHDRLLGLLIGFKRPRSRR
ncbi:MAG: hypothetical protein ACP5M5_09980 [Acidibrevibacterium sp.]|uniref:hypothetical protein n=1 Tax=Acidibrevibacterium sp. TaxID=2606776 RepID=UPI003CFEB383